MWREELGQLAAGSYSNGDGNGVVDQADYTYWTRRFNSTGQIRLTVATSDSVPEPTGWLMLLILLATLCRRWRVS
jgi:hypothetical protein